MSSRISQAASPNAFCTIWISFLSHNLLSPTRIPPRALSVFPPGAHIATAVRADKAGRTGEAVSAATSQTRQKNSSQQENPENVSVTGGQSVGHMFSLGASLRDVKARTLAKRVGKRLTPGEGKIRDTDTSLNVLSQASMRQIHTRQI